MKEVKTMKIFYDRKISEAVENEIELYEEDKLKEAINEDFRRIKNIYDLIENGNNYSDLEYMKKLHSMIGLFIGGENNYENSEIQKIINNSYQKESKYEEIHTKWFELGWEYDRKFDFTVVVLKEIPENCKNCLFIDDIVELEKENYIIILDKNYFNRCPKDDFTREMYEDFLNIKPLLSFEYNEEDIETFTEEKKNAYQQILKFFRKEINAKFLKRQLLYYLKEVLEIYDFFADKEYIKKNSEELQIYNELVNVRTKYKKKK